MIDDNEIVDGLRRMGVKPGMRLEVHSSLSSFGRVRGGAETVVNALLSVVTNAGTVIMPTFPLSKPQDLIEADRELGIVFKKRKLPEESYEPSDMGIIADTFRLRPDVHTGSGAHRCSAWGKDSARYSEGFQHLLQDDGHALLIGVDIRSLTSMHYVESGITDDIWKSVFPPMDPRIIKQYPSSEWFIGTCLNPPYIKGWIKVQEEALRLGLITCDRIGSSRCMHFRVREVVGIYEKRLHDDPYGLFGICKASTEK